MAESATRDRIVLITGASRGIGFVTAQAFLKDGARLAIGARDPVHLATAERALAAHGPVWARTVDLRDPAQIRVFIDAALAHYGRIDVLVNNAGVAWGGEFARETPDSIDAILDINVKGLMHVTRAVLPAMLKQRQGVIINIASGAGKTGYGGLSVYSASKFAVVGFTEALAQEVEQDGVRVYAVCPGAVATDMLEQVTGSRAGMPPEKVAQAVLSLAGPRPVVASGECVEVV